MVNNHYDNAKLNIREAVLNESLFTEYMRRHGMTVKKKKNSKCETTDDFILMKFDYNVPAQENRDKVGASQLRYMYYDYENSDSTDEDNINKKVEIHWPIYDKESGRVIYEKKPIIYRRLMRSPGKAKEGDCIFVRKELYDIAIKYITMSLCDHMPDKNAKIVELSAYDTLVTATAIGYINISLDKILILQDEEVKAKVPAVSVEVENGRCAVKRSSDRQEASNILWDGMGLVDESMFPDNMNGFIYCRSHFFKACLFRGNIQQFFKDYYKDDYNTAYITDMFGNKRKVSDIAVITTNNAIKWIKFTDLMGGTLQKAYSYYERIMEKYENQFAIVKTGHKSKWGNIQRSSYQINNSLPCLEEDKLEAIAKTSIDFCSRLKENHSDFIDYLKLDSQDYSINKVLVVLDEYNKNFKDTEYFRKKKTSIISGLKRKMMEGKLLQTGDNLIICGNPVALLYKSVGIDYRYEQCFEVKDDVIQCYTERFDEGEYLAGFRSPHNSPNNIIYLENVYPEKLMRYFPKLGENVIVINGIGTDVQSRLNGQDLDSDMVYVTNQPQILKAARIAYKEYPTIINNIPCDSVSTYDNDPKSYAKMDIKISSAQMGVGYSSNLAQMALSYYYDELYRTGKRSKELEDVFIICSVLAQCAIDSAKRTFAVNVMGELIKMRSLECMKKYYETINNKDNSKKDVPQVPEFYAKNQKNNKKSKTNENYVVRDFYCPMQILHDIIENKVTDSRRNSRKTCKLKEVFDYRPGKSVKRNYGKQINKIEEITNGYIEGLHRLNPDEESYFQDRKSLYEDYINRIKKYRINKETMEYLIDFSFKNPKICDHMLIALYNNNADIFLKCFKKCPQDN